jgi:uncharacterized membrane protein
MSEIPPAGTPGSTPPGNTPENQPAVPYASAPTPIADPADVEKNKVMAILAYIGILVLVPILAAKDSPFAKYHANQGLVLAIGGIGLGIVMVILSIIVSFIPFVNVVGWCFSCLLFPALTIGWLVLAIIGILNAGNGQMKPLPLLPAFTLIK